MKKFIQILSAAGLGLWLAACTKTNPVTPHPDAAINITNAVIGGTTLSLAAGDTLTTTSNTITNNNYAFLPVFANGSTQVTLGVPYTAASGTVAAMPAVIYYQQALTIGNNDNYSLFLTGTSPTSVDNVLIKENYKYAYSDSVCGVRFINLAPSSNPVSVDIKGQANGSEVASLAYKAYTGFNPHPALGSTPSYVFEFRDAATGNLLTTYTLATPYFHNVTLCLRGLTGNGVIRTNNY